MKTAISLPDAVFEEAERLARRQNKSRSQLYADALAEYLARHSPDEVTEALNSVCDQAGEKDLEFATAAARKLMSREPW